MLSDLDSRVMKDYRLYYDLPDELLAVYKKHGLDIEAYNGKGRAVLPVPGTFVINRQGIVVARHAETDYRKRREPADIIMAFSTGVRSSRSVPCLSSGIVNGQYRYAVGRR